MSEDIKILIKEQFSVLDCYVIMRDAGVTHEKAILTLQNNGWDAPAATIDFIHSGLEEQTYDKYFRQKNVSNPSLSNTSLRRVG